MHRQRGQALHVLGPLGYLGHQQIVLVVGIETADGRASGVIHEKKQLGKSLDPQIVVLFAQVLLHSGLTAEIQQEIVPQSYVVGAQLR